MPMFEVTTVIVDEYDTHAVEADYFVVEDGLLTFKDAKHKQLAAFSAGRVVSAVRNDTRPTAIGSVIVNVVPKVDDAKFAEAIDAAVARYASSVKRGAGLPLSSPKPHRP